jgi:transposase
MGKLSHSTRIQIIGFYFMSLTNEQISIALECDERTVENWINRYNETGDIEALPRSGRPRVTTRADEEDIVAAVVADPFENAVNISKNKGSAVSDTTIRRRLQEYMGSAVEVRHRRND